MDSLDEHNVYRIQPGRVLNEDDGEPVKDSITLGLQSLTGGTKNPLSDYNEAFCLLQKRRKIVPVSVQAENTRSHIPPDVIAEVETQIDSARAENSRSRMLHDAIAEAETQMDTSTDISCQEQQDPQNKDDPFVDSVQEDDNVQEEEVFTEVTKIIEDLENGIFDPTLARLGAGDVALDMDDVIVHDVDEWSDSSSEGSVDGVEDEE